MRKSILSIVTVLALVATANAQNIYLDLDTSVVGGAGLGPPATGYPAAAGIPGCWNAMTGATALNLNNLVTMDGAGGCVPTPVNFTRSTALGGNFAFNNAGTTGNDELLLDDGQDLSASTGMQSFTFTGLTNGNYTVYVYAWAPDFSADLTLVSVNGSPNQTIGGGPANFGGFVAGQTHGVFPVNVVNGTITVMADGDVGSFGTLNGIQIVPEPTTLALLGLGALGLVIRRRR